MKIIIFLKQENKQTTVFLRLDQLIRMHIPENK